MKGRLLGVAIVAFILSASPVKAEGTIFNQASKWIEGWKTPCAMTSTCEKAAPAKEMKAAEGKPVRQVWTTDVLGNKVPAETVTQSIIR